jgi:PIN domain nuclease of toxin-antitoxin system
MKTDKLLLDTHVFLWWRTKDHRLQKDTKEIIAIADLVFISAASAWEVGIKIRLGKLKLPEPFEAGVEHSGFDKLPITFSHARLASGLPLHHRDPFDRMLVAQAQSEKLLLITHDKKILAYDVSALLV